MFDSGVLRFVPHDRGEREDVEVMPVGLAQNFGSFEALSGAARTRARGGERCLDRMEAGFGADTNVKRSLTLGHMHIRT